MVARVLSVIAVGLALVGCMKKSKLYCERHTTDFENCGFLDAGIDARPTCTSDPDCASSPSAPYCEPNAHFCVECYLPEHCAANEEKKFCDPETFLCSTCVTHANCTSEVCLPDGVCGDDGNVAYVDPSASAANTECTVMQKCNTVAKALATMRPYIKLRGTILEAVVLTGRSVTLLAEPGTTLSRSSNGVVLDITGGSDVSVFDLTVLGMAEKCIVIDGGSTARLNRMTITRCNQHDKRAIEVKGSTFFLSRSTIYANEGGGILTDSAATYVLTNNLIYRNGADDSAVGGLSLGATSSGFNRFEMNTIADNRAKTGAVGGAECATTLAAPNNIVARNYSGGDPNLPISNKLDVGGCNFGASMVAPDTVPFAFLMDSGTDPAAWNYRIGPTSMAIDGGVASDLVIDVDGDTRPYNMKFDVGADEYTP